MRVKHINEFSEEQTRSGRHQPHLFQRVGRHLPAKQTWNQHCKLAKPCLGTRQWHGLAKLGFGSPRTPSKAKLLGGSAKWTLQRFAIEFWPVGFSFQRVKDTLILAASSSQGCVNHNAISNMSKVLFSTAQQKIKQTFTIANVWI